MLAVEGRAAPLLHSPRPRRRGWQRLDESRRGKPGGSGHIGADPPPEIFRHVCKSFPIKVLKHQPDFSKRSVTISQGLILNRAWSPRSVISGVSIGFPLKSIAPQEPHAFHPIVAALFALIAAGPR